MIDKLQPKIKISSDKQFVGMSKVMSLTNDTTGELFRTFMPRKKEIQNVKNDKVLDLRVYNESYFLEFNPSSEFEKYVLVECHPITEIPNGMMVYNFIGGEYAVFEYKGLSTDKRIYDYIFRKWLPQSKYTLDQRPHFEVLGPKTKLNDPNSEEEIWVPIKLKSDENV
ncbi:MAG: GyrI-like domain-containing protein [Flavobacteriaceae bacterium]